VHALGNLYIEKSVTFFEVKNKIFISLKSDIYYSFNVEMCGSMA
jgi:hypothetical protein